MNKENTIPLIRNARTTKKCFASSLKSVFLDDSPQCRYSSGDIVRAIRNSITLIEYIETCTPRRIDD